MHFLSSLGLSIHLSSWSLSDRLYFCSPINVPTHLPAFRIFFPNKRFQHWSHGDNLEKLQLPFCFQPSSKKSSRLDFLVAEEEMPIGRLTTWSESKSTHNFYIICSTFVLQMLQKSTLIILTNAFFASEEIFCLGGARGLGPLSCALQTPLTPPALRHRWQPGPANTPPRKYHRQGSFTKYKRTVAP